MGWFPGPRRRRADGLLRLDDALEALGHDGVMGWRRTEVPLASVVGTVNRPYDFDMQFRLVNKCLQDRWCRLDHAVRSGAEPPPVELVQLGDLYFVRDGHHRVSVARSLGREEITARVLRVCTTAYALCCLRLANLPNKAAERQFLNRVPLPVDVRRSLWLDDPAEWMRLADAAEAWAFGQSLEGRAPGDRTEFAARWWSEEVRPLLDRLRHDGVGADMRDIQLYAMALGFRDRLGRSTWPEDLGDQLEPRHVRPAKSLRVTGGRTAPTR